MDGDESGGTSDEDYDSHYDLGMAYLEMDLFADAIREYQLAAKSDQLKIKSLEMIGLCFLRQNQPALAIKQLETALKLIDPSSSDALGVRYNLGLAHEQSGNRDAAKAAFEDVYIVDVTFREVAKKMEQLG